MSILAAINSGKTLVSDGALGTELFKAGLKPGECPDILSVEQPKILEDIARKYLEAGADIISTNTFGATPLKLMDYGLEDQTEAVNQQAVKIVRSVVGDSTWIAGSCGPTGKMLQPHGDTSADEILENYLIQMEVLIGAGADIIFLETFSDLQELLLALKAAREISAAIPVSATMTFDATPRGFFTFMGVDIPSAVSGLTREGADIIGSNCGNGLDNMIQIAAQIRELSDKPLIIQSNAGQPESRSGNLVYSESSEFFEERMTSLLALNPAIIGGCCGTTPDHIRIIRKAVERHHQDQA